MNKAGFSILELIIVMAVLVSLSYFAIPSAELLQVKSREKLLRERLSEIRQGIDKYRAARAEDTNSPYPPSIHSLTLKMTAPSRFGADTGPYVTPEALGNPFTAKGDIFIWDVRDDNPGDWHNNETLSSNSIQCFDIRFPTGGINGWSKAIDETLYEEW